MTEYQEARVKATAGNILRKILPHLKDGCNVQGDLLDELTWHEERAARHVGFDPGVLFAIIAAFALGVIVGLA